MMKLLSAILALLTLTGCGNITSSGKEMETPVSGFMRISADESFKPVISEQIKVFLSSYPKANIEASYKSEADCLRDLQSDSTRLVIISRDLNGKELEYYKTKLQYKPVYDILAYDAIAVIVNRSNADSSFTMAELSEMLSGKKNTNVVVDGKNATSTVRYLLDSVLRGAALGKNVTAAQNSQEVITYVANNAGAIGFVGVSWLSDTDDAKVMNAIRKVKMALIACKNCGTGIFARPSQETIIKGQYPLVRGLHYVLKENWNGLGTGLVNFMTIERGQLIFRRSYLVPGQMQFNRRKTTINTNE